MSRNGLLVLLFTLFLAGCATSRNYQPELDSLNAKIESLQNQLQAKNREVGTMADQVRTLQGQLEATRQEKRDGERNLDDCLGKLSKRSSSASSASKEYAK